MRTRETRPDPRPLGPITGSKNYLVRHPFSECQTWRDTLGGACWLLAMADTGYCIDAPEVHQ